MTVFSLCKIAMIGVFVVKMKQDCVTGLRRCGMKDNYIMVKESLERVVNDLYAAELS